MRRDILCTRASDWQRRGPSHRWVVVAFNILCACNLSPKESRRSGNAHVISSNADDLGRWSPGVARRSESTRYLYRDEFSPSFAYLSARRPWPKATFVGNRTNRVRTSACLWSATGVLPSSRCCATFPYLTKMRTRVRYKVVGWSSSSSCQRESLDTYRRDRRRGRWRSPLARLEWNFDLIKDEVYTRVRRDSRARVWFFLRQFGATSTGKQRVLVIPCLFGVYRWTAHPNVDGRPVPEHTTVYVSLAFPLACVPVRFRRRRYRAKKLWRFDLCAGRKQGTAGICRE